MGREGGSRPLRSARAAQLVLRAAVTDRRQHSAEDVGRAYGIGAADALASPHFLIGTPEQIAADLLERRERWGISYYSIREDGLPLLTPSSPR
jgi:hypothetical protein